MRFTLTSDESSVKPMDRCLNAPHNRRNPVQSQGKRFLEMVAFVNYI